MHSLNSSEISIIIQGAISGPNEFSSNKGVTYDCLKALRKIFPHAEIILSTWKNSNIDNLEYDKLVLNDDPGGYIFSDTDKLNNMNRQILSTQSGLNAANKKYSLKLRSDILMESDAFLKYFDKFSKRTDKYNLFEHKIITSSYFSYKYFKGIKEFMHTPFHVSDWIMFGLTDDVKKLFDVPLADEPAFSQYYKNVPKPDNRLNFFEDCYWQYPPEQYIFFTALKKKYPELEFKDITDYNFTNVKQSEHAMINNFIMIEPYFWKFVLLKEYFCDLTKNPDTAPDFIWLGMYRLTSYKKYYNKMFSIKSLVLPQPYEVLRCIKNWFTKMKNKLGN